MGEHFRMGDRVEYEGFGEGTVIEETAGNQVTVAFSEVETMILPSHELKRLD